MKTPLLLALVTAAGLPLASAQDERRPENPPRPPDAERPPGPRPDGPRERRPEADRPAVEQVDRRPEGERGRERRRPEEPNREGDRRDGPRPEGDRRDGPRVEGEAPGGPGRERPRIPPPIEAQRPQKPTAYIGVVTTVVPPPLTAQLGLADGFGLVVEEIVPDSPAAKVGVQRYDVLKQFNDQLLTDPNQLSTLVRGAGKDAEVSLTLIRKGAEQKVTLKIGERLMPERRPLMGDMDQFMRNLAPMRERAERGAREMRERMETWNSEFGERMRQYQERMKDYTNRLREFHERGKDGQNPGGTPPRPPEPPTPPAPPRLDSDVSPEPADVLRQVRPGGAPGVRVEQDGNVTVWNTANARATIKDDDGEVELRSENGQRVVTARDREGKVIFSGPIDTEDQRAALPENVRRKLDRMDVKVSVRADSPGRQAAEVHVHRPPAPAPQRERDIQ